MQPFFSVITRTMPGRETLLARCRESVAHQYMECEHIILRDEQGVGVAGAQKMLWTVNPKGQYVLVLDDDDYLSTPDALERVRQQIEETPPFVVVKVNHRELGMMPLRWEAAPALGEITVSNAIVSRWLWLRNRTQFGERYAGDFDFIASLFDGAYRCQWIDVQVVTVEKRRMGAIG
jgi:hypothetical protein